MKCTVLPMIKLKALRRCRGAVAERGFFFIFDSEKSARSQSDKGEN